MSFSFDYTYPAYCTKPLFELTNFVGFFSIAFMLAQVIPGANYAGRDEAGQAKHSFWVIRPGIRWYEEHPAGVALPPASATPGNQHHRRNEGAGRLVDSFESGSGHAEIKYAAQNDVMVHRPVHTQRAGGFRLVGG